MKLLLQCLLSATLTFKIENFIVGYVKKKKQKSQARKKKKCISTWGFLLLVILYLVKVSSPIATYPLQIKESALTVWIFCSCNFKFVFS